MKVLAVSASLSFKTIVAEQFAMRKECDHVNS